MTIYPYLTGSFLVYQQLIGKAALSNTMVLASNWSQANENQVGDLETKSGYLVSFLDGGARLSKSHEPGHDLETITSYVRHRKPITLQLQKDIITLGKYRLRQTAVGKVIDDYNKEMLKLATHMKKENRVAVSRLRDDSGKNREITWADEDEEDWDRIYASCKRDEAILDKRR